MFKKILLFAIVALVVAGCAGQKYQLTPEAREIEARFASLQLPNKQMLLAGTEYQTAAYVFDSHQPGPAILIIGGTHGNEPAGYEAALRLLDRLYRQPPQAGKVILIPEANIQAIRKYKRRIPVPENVHYEKGNLNRCYPGKPDGLPMERLAYQIQQLAEQHQVQAFIDLHEARDLHLKTGGDNEKKKLGQTIIYYPNEPSSMLMINMLDEINSEIDDPMEQFSPVEMPIKHSAAWWAGKYLNIAAFTFETSRTLPLERRIGYHLRLVDIVFRSLGVY